MASSTDIANRALQKLGASIITSLTEASVNARACNLVYDKVRRSELRRHTWNFSVKRENLAASNVPPLFGPKFYYPLPTDFLRLLAPDPQMNREELDWTIEGRNIVTSQEAPLQIRYVSDVTDVNTFDDLFRESMASRMALEMCEQLTQSNEKKQYAKVDYTDAINEATKVNAIEKPSVLPPDDTWITVRR